MLCETKYTQAFVDQARSGIKRQLEAFRSVSAAASNTKNSKIDAALTSFEPLFFNHMVLAMDNYFTHRSRTMEGKDGNALNEVRVLCNSIRENKAVLFVDAGIKLKPETSVLKLKVGDTVALTSKDFERLSKAFFDEMERKFV